MCILASTPWAWRRIGTSDTEYAYIIQGKEKVQTPSLVGRKDDIL